MPARFEQYSVIEDRSRRAVAAAVEVARQHGLTVGEPVVLADLFSLMVHLQPAPVVARVSTCMPRLRSPIADWLRLELDVTSYLAARGAPVITPSTELPAGPHDEDGFAISFWTYLVADPDRTPTTADCAAMLVDLHAELRTYPGELPRFCVNDINRGLEMLDQAAGDGVDALSDDEVDLLRSSAERLVPKLVPLSESGQPLHGDVHPGNLMSTQDGLVWIDFEDVCRGPVEWDLASIMDPVAVAAHHQPDPEILVQCTQLRSLQVALALVAFYADFGHQEGWDDGLRALLATLAAAS